MIMDEGRMPQQYSGERNEDPNQKNQFENKNVFQLTQAIKTSVDKNGQGHVPNVKEKKSKDL